MKNGHLSPFFNINWTLATLFWIRYHDSCPDTWQFFQICVDLAVTWVFFSISSEVVQSDLRARQAWDFNVWIHQAFCSIYPYMKFLACRSLCGMNKMIRLVRIIFVFETSAKTRLFVSRAPVDPVLPTMSRVRRTRQPVQRKSIVFSEVSFFKIHFIHVSILRLT